MELEPNNFQVLRDFDSDLNKFISNQEPAKKDEINNQLSLKIEGVYTSLDNLKKSMPNPSREVKELLSSILDKSWSILQQSPQDQNKLTTLFSKLTTKINENFGNALPVKDSMNKNLPADVVNKESVNKAKEAQAVDVDPRSLAVYFTGNRMDHPDTNVLSFMSSNPDVSVCSFFQLIQNKENKKLELKYSYPTEQGARVGEAYLKALNTPLTLVKEGDYFRLSVTDPVAIKSLITELKPFILEYRQEAIKMTEEANNKPPVKEVQSPAAKEVKAAAVDVDPRSLAVYFTGNRMDHPDTNVLSFMSSNPNVSICSFFQLIQNKENKKLELKYSYPTEQGANIGEAHLKASNIPCTISKEGDYFRLSVTDPVAIKSLITELKPFIFEYRQEAIQMTEEANTLPK